jgi:hypothetical protein
MKKILLLLSFLCFITASFSQSKKGPCTPKFLRKEIRLYKKEVDIKKTPVITRYLYNGAYVYYYRMPCCDQQNTLKDKKGNVLCVPDGGITGKGDGKCPDFSEKRSDPKQLWPKVERD